MAGQLAVGATVSLKNPNGDDTCIGIIEGTEDGQFKVVYFPATSPVEHRQFDAGDLTKVG